MWQNDTSRMMKEFLDKEKLRELVTSCLTRIARIQGMLEGSQKEQTQDNNWKPLEEINNTGKGNYHYYHNTDKSNYCCPSGRTSYIKHFNGHTMFKDII